MRHIFHVMRKHDVFSQVWDSKHTHLVVQLYSGNNYVCLKEITHVRNVVGEHEGLHSRVDTSDKVLMSRYNFFCVIPS